MTPRAYVGNYRRSALVGLLLVGLLLGGPTRAEAFVPAVTGPALAPAATGVLAAMGPIGWTILGVAAVGGVAYVGYRGWQGDPVQWWWDGTEDPAAAQGTEVITMGDLPVVEESRYASGFSRQVIFSFTEDWYNDTGNMVYVRAHCPAGYGSSSYVSIVGEGQWAYEANTYDRAVKCASPTMPAVDHMAYLSTWTIESGGVVLAEMGFAPGEGFAGGAEAQVRVDYECTDVATSTVTSHTAYGDSYADPAVPASMPGTVLCAEGLRMTGARAFRELPGHPDEPLTEPLVIPTTAPDFIPTEWETEWNECLEQGDCELVIEDVRGAEPRRMVPPWDVGWWWNPDRDSDYQCSYLMPDGTKIPLPLEQCAPLQWEWDEPTKTWVKQPTTAADPELHPPTQTGEPPEAPQLSDNCFTGGSESSDQGFVSRVVFHGVACALQWAFVPSPASMAQMQQAGESIATKAPFSYPVQVHGWLVPLADLPDECLQVSMPIAEYGTYDVVDACDESHQLTGWLTTWRPLLATVIYGSFLIPLAWWAWRTYAPGSKGLA